MKLKNLIFTGIAAVTMLLPVTASAQRTMFYDTAELVSPSEYSKVNEVLSDVSSDHNVDVLVHTTDSLGNLDIAAYADQWYEINADNTDGLVLVVCTSPRKYYIMTTGSCIYSFTDAGLDFIEAQIVPKMSKDDYAGAFLKFADLCDDYLVQAEKGRPYDSNRMPKEPFDFVVSLLISVGVGLAAGTIGIFMLFANLKSVKQQHGAADYQKPNSFHLDTHRDIYLYRKVERREKEQETNRSGGGSSTHTGASGHTRGGSGGAF